jgi:hypothetical protein
MATSSFTLLSANTKDHLALVQSTDGSTIEISWEELQPYCKFANPPRDEEETRLIWNTEPFDEEAADYRENDYSAIATVGHHLVVCLTEAQGQGGVVGVRDLITSNWVYIAREEYIQAALPLFDHGLIVILVDINVPYIGSPNAGKRVWVAPLDGILDAEMDRSEPLPIKPPLSADHRAPSITDVSVIFNSPHSGGGCYGLFFDPETQILHAGDGPTFSAQYSLSELQFILQKGDV